MELEKQNIIMSTSTILKSLNKIVIIIKPKSYSKKSKNYILFSFFYHFLLVIYSLTFVFFYLNFLFYLIKYIKKYKKQDPYQVLYLNLFLLFLEGI